MPIGDMLLFNLGLDYEIEHELEIASFSVKPVLAWLNIFIQLSKLSMMLSLFSFNFLSAIMLANRDKRIKRVNSTKNKGFGRN